MHADNHDDKDNDDIRKSIAYINQIWQLIKYFLLVVT